jgi:TonB family protein
MKWMPTKKEREKISYSLILSLVLHFGFAAYFAKTAAPEFFSSSKHFVAANNKEKLTTLKLDSIKFISPKQLKAIKDSQHKQIVANELRGKEERPVNSRFLGEKDQTFERQTLAAANGAFKEAGKGKKEGSKSSTEQNEPVVKKVASTPKLTGPKKALTLSDLGAIKMADIEKMQTQSEAAFEETTKKLAAEKKSAAEGVERGKVGTTGLAQNSDFVEEVPLGDMTNLNTTEFKYYGFYHRIRQKLEQHWGSSIKDKARSLYRSGRRMPASENLITSVSVTLDDHGQIVDMQIEGTSGVRELDQAAIESFNKAGPFPNPPKGLLVGGRATIQWGFVVKS